jgi:hypothetical protein
LGHLTRVKHFCHKICIINQKRLSKGELIYGLKAYILLASFNKAMYIFLRLLVRLKNEIIAKGKHKNSEYKAL